MNEKKCPNFSRKNMTNLVMYSLINILSILAMFIEKGHSARKTEVKDKGVQGQT